MCLEMGVTGSLLVLWDFRVDVNGNGMEMNMVRIGQAFSQWHWHFYSHHFVCNRPNLFYACEMVKKR